MLTITEAVEATNQILKSWKLKATATSADFLDYFKYSDRMEFTRQMAIEAANAIQEERESFSMDNSSF